MAIKEGKGSGGILARDAKIIRALLPIRDAVREVLRAQAADQPWAEAQVRLRIAYSSFVRGFGPINHTVVSVTTDPETGEERETHRRPNLAPFADDPDCWLVASIEDYDLESGLARMGPIFRERVIAPPSAPLIATAADALAVTLNETGRVDIDHLAELLDRDPETALAQLGEAVFRNPCTEAWETDDAYLSGSVRTKLALAEAAAERDPQYARNVAALRLVQPEDLRPSDITARLGAPWIPAADIEAFAAEVMGTATRVRHTVEIASWSVDIAPFVGTAAGTSEWGTARRNAGWLLHDALNSATPQIFDTIVEDGVEKRVLNSEATEAAKEKLARIKEAFTGWVWTDPDRTDRLARLYNDRFNNLVPRRFDGRHLTLPGASTIIRLYEHQKRVIWRIVASGSTYIAHTVGAGKSYAIAGAIMEQKRLGLISKAMLVVPGHCLAQVSREFLQLYPTARILVADETNFVKAKRSRFLARAATANWDAVIITHAAFRFIPVPAGFEREMIEEQIAACADLMLRADDGDRITRKRLEAMKEKLAEKLAALKDRRDDMVTLEEIGIDQIIVDEAQEFRKLSFATNQINLKGVDPDGSQRAWDLFVKARYLDRKRPGRALIQASGTPITNTLGEMYTLLRFQAPEALRERGVHEFDAWASAFGDTSTELELQPSGAYKPVTRFAAFINVADLMMMFRSIADVVQKTDLRGQLDAAAHPHRPAPTGHGRGEPGLQGLSEAPGAPDRGDRSPHRQGAEGRRHPAFRHHRRAARRDRHAAGLARKRRRTGEQAQQADRQRSSHLGRDGGAELPPARRHAVSDPGRRADDLLRPRHDQCRGDARLLGLSLDQAASHRPRGSRRADRVHAGLQALGGQAAVVRRLPRRARAGADRLVGHDGHRRQRAAAAEGPAPSRRAVAAESDRAARGPHRAAGQPARRDRHFCLRHAWLDGRHDVAEQRAQGAVHRGRAVGRPRHPPPGGCRQPGQPVRDGQGDCVG